MDREQTVEAVANIEREFNELVHGGVSDDSLVVLYRQLGVAALEVHRHGLPTAKVDQLDEAIVTAMSSEAKERAFAQVRSLAHTPPQNPLPPIEGSMSGADFMAELQKRAAAGQPIQIVTNPVNPDGSLTPEAQAILDNATEECEDCANGTCELPEHQHMDPDYETQEDIDATREEMEAKLNRPPPQPQKSHDERRKDVSDLFGDLSL
jgi:hypothetical protein